MKGSREFALLATCFIIAAAGGWFAAGRSAPSSLETIPSAATKSTDRKSSRTAREMPPEIAARLAPFRAARTQDERLRAITLLAQSLPVSELAAWYEAGWIPRRETIESLQFYHITGKRWLAEDGEGMVRYHLAKDRSRMDACRDWGWQDPAAAFKFLDELKDPKDFALMMNSIASLSAKADPKQGLERITRYQTALMGESSWGIGHMIYQIARGAPELLKKEAANWPERMRREAFQEIDRGALEKDFAGALAAFANEPDGKERFLKAAVSRELQKDLLAHIDKLPEGWLPDLLQSGGNNFVRSYPDRWFDADYASIGIDEDQARKLRTAAAGTLARTNPERLPELLAADLDPSRRDSLIQTSLTRLYLEDPAKAEQLRDQLGLPTDMEGLWGKVVAAGSANEPPRHLESPAQLRDLLQWDKENRSYAVAKMQAWDAAQIQEAIQVLGSSEGEDRGILADALSDWDAPVPLRAESFRYIVEDQGDALVGDRRFTQLCQFANTWGGQEPGAAARWVESLPQGQSRLWMAKNVAGAWAIYDPAAAAKWIDSQGLKGQLDGLGKEE